MIKIELIINTDHLDEVLSCVSDLKISMLNFYEVNSIGNNIKKPTIYRGVTHSSSYTPKTKLEIITTEDMVLSIKGNIENSVNDNLRIAPIEIFVTEIKDTYQIS